MRRENSVDLRLQRRFVSEIHLEQVSGISRHTWQKHRLSTGALATTKFHAFNRSDLKEVVSCINNFVVTCAFLSRLSSIFRNDSDPR
jgi:hypothetical protein